MRNLLSPLAIIGAVILTVIALITLSMELYIVSGTAFTFVAFLIYIRETNK